MADGHALHVTRTKAFSAVEIQKTLESRLLAICFPVLLQNMMRASARSVHHSSNNGVADV
jgi:hypothetical protein